MSGSCSLTEGGLLRVYRGLVSLTEGGSLTVDGSRFTVIFCHMSSFTRHYVSHEGSLSREVISHDLSTWSPMTNRLMRVGIQMSDSLL